MKRFFITFFVVFLLIFCNASAELQMNAAVKTIEATYDKVFFLTEDGTLFVSGNPNSYDDNYFGSSVPYFLDDMVEKICVSYRWDDNIVYIKKDSTLWRRTLNYGHNMPKSEPEYIMKNVKDVYNCFDNYYIILTDGSLWTMGPNNSSGMLGNGTKKASKSPQKIMDNVKIVYGSDSVSYVHVLTEDGKLYGIGGDDISPVIGNGKKSDCTTPVLVMENVKEAYPNIRCTFALTNSGELYAWGLNGKKVEQGITAWVYLGTGGSSDIKSPTLVLENVHDFEFGIGGCYHAVTNDGKLWAWGGSHSITYTYPGTGNKEQIKKPTVIMEPDSPIKELGVGYVILEDNSLWAWGQYLRNDEIALSPTCIAKNVKAYNSTFEHTFGTAQTTGRHYLDMDNNLWAWEEYTVTIDEDHHIVALPHPIEKPILLMSNVDQFLDLNRNFASTLDGKLYAWGRPSGIGYGLSENAGQYQYPPAQIRLEDYYPDRVVAKLSGNDEKIENTQKIKQLLVHYDSHFAVTETGKLWVWGKNNGRLGTMNTKNYPLPTCIMENVDKIYTNEKGYFDPAIFALMKNQDLYYWQALNRNNTSADSIKPTCIASDVVFVLPNDDSALYMDTQNTVWLFSNGTSTPLLHDVISYTANSTSYIYFLDKNHSIWEYRLFNNRLDMIAQRDFIQIISNRSGYLFALDEQGVVWSYGSINAHFGANSGTFHPIFSSAVELVEFPNHYVAYAKDADGTLWSLFDCYENEDDYEDYELISRPLIENFHYGLSTSLRLYAVSTDGIMYSYRYKFNSAASFTEPKQILTDVIDISLSNSSVCMMLKNDGSIWRYDDEEEKAHRLSSLPNAKKIIAIQKEHYFVIDQEGRLFTAGDDEREMGVFKLPESTDTLVPVQLNNELYPSHVQKEISQPLNNLSAAESKKEEQSKNENVYVTLTKGNKGNAVLEMKKRLQELGYFKAGAEISNIYNDTCVERVKQFQSRNGLPKTGVADPETLACLFSDEAIHK